MYSKTYLNIFYNKYGVMFMKPVPLLGQVGEGKGILSKFFDFYKIFPSYYYCTLKGSYLPLHPASLFSLPHSFFAKTSHTKESITVSESLPEIHCDAAASSIVTAATESTHSKHTFPYLSQSWEGKERLHSRKKMLEIYQWGNELTKLIIAKLSQRPVSVWNWTETNKQSSYKDHLQ